MAHEQQQQKTYKNHLNEERKLAQRHINTHQTLSCTVIVHRNFFRKNKKKDQK